MNRRSVGLYGVNNLLVESCLFFSLVFGTSRFSFSRLGVLGELSVSESKHRLNCEIVRLWNRIPINVRIQFTCSPQPNHNFMIKFR